MSESTIGQSSFSPTYFPVNFNIGSPTVYGFSIVEMWAIFGTGGVTTSTTTVTSTTTTTVASTTFTTTLSNVLFGSCGSKDLASSWMANNTVYLYEYVATSSGYINNLSVMVAQTKSGVPVGGSFGLGLRLGIYVTTSSIQPLVLMQVIPVPLDVRTTHRWITLNPSTDAYGGPISLNAGDIVAYAILGNDHIKLNQSTASTTAMYEATSVTSSGYQYLPAKLFPIDVLGTDHTPHIYACANVFYGGITITSTTTSYPTATVTRTLTTMTTGVNSPNPDTLSFWFIPLFFLLLPMGLLVAFGAQAHAGGPAIMFLAVLGLTLGSWLGTMANIIPLGLSLLFSVAMVIVIWRTGG